MYNIVHRKKKNCFILIFLVFSLVHAFSQDTYLLYVYSQINDHVETKNVAAIDRLLVSHKESKDYNKIESYILTKAREQLIGNNLDLALKLSYVVVDNNLDNFEAATLYDSIERLQKAEEEKKRLEAEKAQIESIKQAQTVEKDTQKIQKEYQTITNTASGQRLYLDQDVDDYYQSITWAAGIGLANFSGIINIPQIEGFFGVSALANLFYRSELIHAGVDLAAYMGLSSFSDLEFLPMKAEAHLNIAFPKLAKYFYYRVGALGLLTYFDEGIFLSEKFFTPSVGLAFRDLGNDSFMLGFHFDYHLAQFLYDDIVTSFDAGLNLYLRFIDLKKADVGLIIGLEDSFFYTNKGMQNHAKINLSIGVWNND